MEVRPQIAADPSAFPEREDGPEILYVEPGGPTIGLSQRGRQRYQAAQAAMHQAYPTAVRQQVK